MTARLQGLGRGVVVLVAALVLLLSGVARLSVSLSATSTLALACAATVVGLLSCLLADLTLARDERSWGRLLALTGPVLALVAVGTVAAVGPAGAGAGETLLAVLPWLMSPLLAALVARRLDYALPRWTLRRRPRTRSRSPMY